MERQDPRVKTTQKLVPDHRFPVKWGEVALPVREVDIACLTPDFVNFLRGYPRAMQPVVDFVNSVEFRVAVVGRFAPFTPWKHNVKDPAVPMGHGLGRPRCLQPYAEFHRP
jgi:hypothetical protein